VHCSNSAVSASTRPSIIVTFGAALAAQAAQLEHLLGELAALVAQRAQHRRLDLVGAFDHHLLEHVAAIRQQLRAERRLERRQPALAQGRVVARDATGERHPCRDREDVAGVDAERARRLAQLLRDLQLDLALRGERVGERVDLVEDDEALRRVRAEVVPPDRQVGLGHARVRAEDEDGGVGGRQQAEGELRLGADRVQAWRVEHHQTLLEQRVRVVDDGVPPRRHLDQPFVVARRVVIGVGVVPEAERTGPLLGDVLGAGDLDQRLGQAVGVVDVQLDPAPGARLQPQLGQRQPFEAGLDRQQHERRRLVVAPAELDRAHRRAAGCRRQDPPAGVGEEDGVDELRLAARELGDEGHHQLLVAEPFAQRRELVGSLAVGEGRARRGIGQVLEALAVGGTPAAEGVEAGGERRVSSRGAGFESWYRRARAQSGIEKLPRPVCAAVSHTGVAPAARVSVSGSPRKRMWPAHPGQCAAPWRRSAPAWARPAVDAGLRLEGAGGTVRVAEIAQRGSAQLDGAGKRRANRQGEPLGPRPADSVVRVRGSIPASYRASQA
jgi:hypothetical protein